MKIVVGMAMAVVALYGLAHLAEMSSFYADPKATVLQQISLRLNLGFIALSLVICVCTFAIIEAIERAGRQIGQAAAPPIAETMPPQSPDVAPQSETPEQRRERMISSVKNPFARALLK